MYASKQRALRAIGAGYLWRVGKPAIIIILILVILAYTLVIFAALQWSSLWLLLLIGLIPATLILVGIVLVLSIIHRTVLPRTLSGDEKRKIRSFIETIDRLVERGRTPYPLLLFLIAKDVIRGKESRVLTEVIGDSKTVMTEFKEIERLF